MRLLVFRLIATLFLTSLVLLLFTAPTHSSSGEIMITNVGDLVSLTWSATSKEIFVARRTGGVVANGAAKQTILDLFRINLDSGDLKIVSSNAAYPAPSPSGRQLAFISLGQDGRGLLQLLDLDSGVSHDLGLVDWGSQPVWSKDGTGLFATAEQKAVTWIEPAGNQMIDSSRAVPFSSAYSLVAQSFAYVANDQLNLVSGGKIHLVSGPVSNLTVAAKIIWSHDGKRLAFLGKSSGNKPELWIINWDGSGPMRLASGGLEDFDLAGWSANDSEVMFTRTPTGSSVVSASEIWTARVTDKTLTRLTRDREEQSSPRYSPDGSEIAFLRGGDLWVMQNFQGFPGDKESIPSMVSLRNSPSPSLPKTSGLAPMSQLTPPPTIRVIHSENNTCRNVPVGQIDILDFETYVKQVVPAEVPSSWPAESLKTQAVAARSYGWYWVLQHQNGQYDVSDSTAYQYMCDRRYGSTDAAVDATRGQYGSYKGNVIFAAYGANNGDPTVTNSWQNPYLVSVDDPVDFGDQVSGNGLGMSQWGADRWAMSPYFWSYQMILAHYYSGVTIESPAGGIPDNTAPTGGLTAPWSNWGVASNEAFFSANASDDNSGVASVDLVADYDSNGTRYKTMIAHLTQPPWQYVWDMSSLADQSGVQVVPTITDHSGNSFTGNGVMFTLDRGLPNGTVTGPPSTDKQTVTLQLTANDVGPSGLDGMTFSNNLIWEGENQQLSPPNCGVPVDDPGALNGKAMFGQAGVNPPGAWYGPYTQVLPVNSSYRAYFRLKTDNVSTPLQVAKLDVVDNVGATLLGMKQVLGTDFKQAGSYQEFYVDFSVGPSVSGLEFRVAYPAVSNLWLDRIIVVSYPVSFASSTQWTLSPGNGMKTVQAKFVDGAGNISLDAITNIYLGPLPSPTPAITATPTPTPLPALIPRIWLPFVIH